MSGTDSTVQRAGVGSVQFPAFGTTAVVSVAQPAMLGAARAVVQELVDQFDQACSRFRKDSELSALNRSRGSVCPAGPLLLDALGAALRAAQLTDGDVDPTVGQALIALGYDRDFEAVHERVAPAPVAFAAVPGWRAVELDRGAGTIRLKPGVTLDLGATAKALAADRAAAAAAAAVGCGVLVGFGGDLGLGGAAPAQGWRVYVTDDHRAGAQAPGQWIMLHGGGLATSSTVVRRWRAGEDTHHHLLDPSTGLPARGVWRTASVAAASCVDANTASTAAIVRGERAPAWLTSLRLPSRLVSSEGTALHLAGWPEDGDALPCAAAVPHPVSAAEPSAGAPR